MRLTSRKTRRPAEEEPRNEQLPEHLPRYEVQLDVPEDKKTCPSHGERKVIGYDSRRPWRPYPKLVVRRT